MDTKQKESVARRTLIVLGNEGIIGLMKRIADRFRDKSQLEIGYHLLANLNDIKAPPPKIDVEIKEVSVADDKYLDELATIPVPSYSKAQIVQFLLDGRQCYVAIHEGQVVCCYWVLKKGFRYYRDFVLADNEEYHLSGYTLPEFRGRGIMPHLVAVIAQERNQLTPNIHAIENVAVNNKAQLRSVKKQGFSKVGFVGFVRMLGFRFHFIIGRRAFPKTTKRFYLERL